MKRSAALALTVMAAVFGPAAHPGSGWADPAAPAPLLTPNADVYSGYGAVAPEFTVLTAHWREPEVSCPPSGIPGGLVNTVMTGSSIQRIPGLAAVPGGVEGVLFVPHVATWIGLVGMNGATDRHLIQTGTAVICDGGVAYHQAFFETPSFGDQAGMPEPDANAPGNNWDTPATMPGDELEATITWDGHETYRLVVADTTRGWRFGATSRNPVVPTGALAVVESIPYNVPGFTPVTFTGVTADGKPLDSYAPRPLTITATSTTPTALTGGSFTVPAP
ncbi:G1 family glutamic endopeptidase [Nocardia seriolae]|nr:G1 family glutamic endopeptidase [Nocardia seriolae]QUN19680.1 hypothetical protein KEC46_10355 [Nocardia seriolae]WKY52781.1 G1 family glutamic endopeptidase [Nocardia seriolae]